MSVLDSGSSGTTIAQVFKGTPPGVLTTQYGMTLIPIFPSGDRPAIAAAANANQSILAAQPSTTNFEKGAGVVVAVEQVALGAADLTLTMTFVREGDLG